MAYDKFNRLDGGKKSPLSYLKRRKEEEAKTQQLSCVDSQHGISRIEVPGGWIYAHNGAGVMSTVFVPFPKDKK